MSLTYSPDTDLDRLIDRILLDHRDLGLAEVVEVVVSAILQSPNPRIFLAPIVRARLEPRVAAPDSTDDLAATNIEHPNFGDAVAERVGQEADNLTEPIQGASPADPLADRLTWLRDRIYVNKERGWVAWANLSIGDHRARIEDLKHRGAGIQLEIAKHRQAIRDIQQHNVRTLADVYKVQVA